ncbi:ABC transporter ATP-binding protein [Haladaptatus cibarius]|uniref:ABC transporter ATP-binding protein n=1 Tax=Haladaptatus cibarius TaxID=453847 RepID=UPI000679A298|nr:ABC transporter ATP-binding protein [Haladaptatus cibarius]
MANLRLKNLRKEFDRGQIVAVDDLNLDIEDGEFVTLVGPSGCGKTTTLRMIAGLERATSGNIYIGDDDVTNVHAKNRDVAMVFQNYALYPHKTVEENMSFGLRMSTDLSKDERYERVYEAAEMMGIEDLLDDKPDELSGGQKQRVALGRAIVREPDIFLFDEPLSNLDAKLRTTMRTEIQRIQQELGITAVYVTHDQEEAMTMGDRIVILRDGELQQMGAPTTVYENPTNSFVGGFVGSPSMNFIDVRATNDSGEIVLRDGEGDFSCRLSSSFSGRIENTNEQFTVGIRPEDVFPATGEERNVLETTVEVVEPIGSDNYLYLDLTEDFIARVDSDVEPSPGDRIQVTFAEDDVHVFDSENGKVVSDEKETAKASV